MPELAKYHKDSGFMYEVVDFTSIMEEELKKYFFIAHDPKDLIELEDYLRTHFGDKTTIVYSSNLLRGDEQKCIEK